MTITESLDRSAEAATPHTMESCASKASRPEVCMWFDSCANTLAWKQRKQSAGPVLISLCSIFMPMIPRMIPTPYPVGVLGGLTAPLRSMDACNMPKSSDSFQVSGHKSSTCRLGRTDCQVNPNLGNRKLGQGTQE